MRELIWVIPAAPLAGFVLLVLGRALGRRAVAGIGIASVAVAADAAIWLAARWFAAAPEGGAWTSPAWDWFRVGDFAPRFALRLDALSLVMVLVVTVVGLLIHIYSAAYMAGEEGYGRFFAYMNLFVASMLILLLADNLLLLYLGWEGVGLCSYLLIGFWYKDRANGRAAMKAFLVTRVGDAALAIAFFLLFLDLRTLDIQELMRRAAEKWADAPAVFATLPALLLLAGAVGKSAQLPLQAWLPDAMAGPTPVSALIHAATMVTAGVYLIARMHGIFDLAPDVRLLVAIIGTATMLLAGCSALVQRDIKRVLAYSTMSQIGYMFLALGVGAYSAAIFHFFTHAFFKSLLFLAAGAVILTLHHEQDLFKMGGLRRRMPLVFWTILIGAASLAGLPLVTAGFYSKDLILAAAWESPRGGHWLWAAGIVGAAITSLYAFRMVFLAFFGEPRVEKCGPLARTSRLMTVPLVILASLSILAGFVQLPAALGDAPLFTNFMSTALPALRENASAGANAMLLSVSGIVSLAGVLVAYLLFRSLSRAQAMVQMPATEEVRRYWLAGWGFDWWYDVLFVRPVAWFARVNRADFVDLAPRAIAWASVVMHRVLARTQTGRVRWYAACMAAGVVAVVAALVWR